MRRSTRVWLFVTCGLGLLVVVLILFSMPTVASDVPFPTEHVVASSFMGASAIHAADVDGDGDLDVLGAASAGFGEITWWENGDGSGTAWTEHTVDGDFAGAASVHAGDLDGDGDMDVVGAAESQAGEIAWWENSDGSGTAWIPRTVYTFVTSAYSVYAADVDGDGDLDVVGAGYESVDAVVAWWENTAGDGTAWSQHDVDGAFEAESVHAADVDGDGDLDVLGASYYADDITWWENTAGDGTAWTAHPVDGAFGGAASVYAADMDGDGDLDVLGAAFDDDAVTWWENADGGGTSWAQHAVDTAFDGAESVYAADVDGDGDLDLLGAADLGPEITWWENTGACTGPGGACTNWPKRIISGNLRSTHSVYAQPRSVYAADLDGDGDMDVLGAISGADEIVWWENETIHSSAAFPAAGKQIVDDAFWGAWAARTADVDGDGDLDILSALYYNNTVAWWENADGSGSTWTTHVVSDTFSSPRSVYAADVNGDGDLDLLGAGGFEGIIWWENDGTPGDGGWIKHSVTGFEVDVTSVHAADVDGDGDLDVLGTMSAWPGEIIWWENSDGAGTDWLQHPVTIDFFGAWSVHAADMDRDGDLDVLGAAVDLGDITWWENANVTGTLWIPHPVDGDFAGAYAVHAADMDGDGDPDFLGAANNADAIAWWENAGDGTVTATHVVTDAFESAHAVYAADVDGDGDLDLLGAAAGNEAPLVHGRIVWWENDDGSGTAWTGHPVEDLFDSANSVHAADIDGDGAPDILGAAAISTDIVWWKNQGGQFALDTADTAPLGIISGERDDVLRITVDHRGQAGDTDEALATLELLFEESGGGLLTSAEANALVENLHVYLDDGSGAFKAPPDLWVTTVSTLSLVSGTQTVTFTTGDPNVRVTYGASRTYFVVPELTADANVQTPNQFRITHVTEESSSVVDWAHGIPLLLEYAANIPSGLVSAVGLISDVVNPINGGTLIFTDTQGLLTLVEVPTGAVVQSATLVFMPLISPTHPLSPGTCFAGHAFYLDAYCLPQLPQRFIYLPLILRNYPSGQSTVGTGDPVPARFPAPGPVYPERAASPLASRPAAARLRATAPISGWVPCDLTFQKPVTITIHYSDADLACVSDENALRLDYWTGSAWQDAATICTPPAGYLRDPDGNVIGVPICHLTEWSLEE